MTYEQSFFLTCLADHCHGRKTPRPAGIIDLNALYNTATAHSLAGLVYIQCRDWMDERSYFYTAFLGDVFYSVNRTEMLREISERFERERIPHILMKGAVLRDTWPVPELRSMGDVDLIIHTQDRETSDRIMINDFGCRKMVDNHAVWTYYCGKLEFEVHDHMFYESLANRCDYRKFFDSVWDHVQKESVFGISSEMLYIPDTSFHFLYLMAHTAKHVINKGIGFRSFLDMVFLAHTANELDWDYMESVLEELQLLDFTRTCFALCEEWFKVQMPLGEKKISHRFFQETTEKVLQDGIFGLDNRQNEAAHSAKELKKSTYPYWISVIILTFQKLFPPYEDMQLIPWYSWVDGKPWLMPLAWIYRWFYCLFHKRKTAFSQLTEPVVKKVIIETREHSIREWGL